MKVYTFSNITQWSTEIIQVIAESEEDARKIINNDGRNSRFFELETVFNTNESGIGIVYSLEVGNENYQG